MSWREGQQDKRAERYFSEVFKAGLTDKVRW